MPGLSSMEAQLANPRATTKAAEVSSQYSVFTDCSSPPPSSSHFHRQHRNGTAIYALNRKCDRVGWRASAHDVEQRQIMIWRGYRQFCFAAELVLVIHERLVLVREKQLAHSCFKRDRPIVGLRRVPSPGIGMQVVHDIAASQNENAFFP